MMLLSKKIVSLNEGEAFVVPVSERFLCEREGESIIKDKDQSNQGTAVAYHKREAAIDGPRAWSQRRDLSASGSGRLGRQMVGAEQADVGGARLMRSRICLKGEA